MQHIFPQDMHHFSKLTQEKMGEEEITPKKILIG